MRDLLITAPLPERPQVKLGFTYFGRGNEGTLRCSVYRASFGYEIHVAHVATNTVTWINVLYVPLATYTLDQRVQWIVEHMEAECCNVPASRFRGLLPEMSTFAAPLIAADSFFTAR